jgi:hypothetical protein
LNQRGRQHTHTHTERERERDTHLAKGSERELVSKRLAPVLAVDEVGIESLSGLTEQPQVGCSDPAAVVSENENVWWVSVRH